MSWLVQFGDANSGFYNWNGEAVDNCRSALHLHFFPYRNFPLPILLTEEIKK